MESSMATPPYTRFKSHRRLNGRERQQLILDLILHHQELSINHIAEVCDTSLTTARRDLESLERRGLIERTWGGARVRSPISYLDNFRRSAEHASIAKRAIAAQAIQRVRRNMIVGLSGGTTCTELARWLRGKPVTVVTNAINVATELYNHFHTKVIVTGGALNSYSYEVIGEMVAQSLQNYRLDICFVGCSGVTPEAGVSMRDESEAAVARAFQQVSDSTIVLGDSSKVGKRTFARFADLPNVDLFITDEEIDIAQGEALRDAGLNISIAPDISKVINETFPPAVAAA